MNGVVDAGLLVDDSDRYVVGPDLRRLPERRLVARFVVTLTTIEEAA